MLWATGPWLSSPSLPSAYPHWLLSSFCLVSSNDVGPDLRVIFGLTDVMILQEKSLMLKEYLRHDDDGYRYGFPPFTRFLDRDLSQVARLYLQLLGQILVQEYGHALVASGRYGVSAPPTILDLLIVKHQENRAVSLELFHNNTDWVRHDPAHPWVVASLGASPNKLV